MRVDPPLGAGRNDAAGGGRRRELAPIEFVRLRIEGCVSAVAQGPRSAAQIIAPMRRT